MKKTLDRRRLLALAALVGAAGGATYTGAWWYFKGRAGDTEAMILSILRRHLGPLRAREEDLRAFARALRPRFTQQRGMAMFGMLGPVYERVDLLRELPLVAASLQSFEDQVVGEFLLSTNVFTDWPGEPAPVEYLGLRAAGPLICQNPFARFEPE